MKRGYAIEFKFYSYKVDAQGNGVSHSAVEMPGSTYSGSLTLAQKQELEKMIRLYLDKGRFQ